MLIIISINVSSIKFKILKKNKILQLNALTHLVTHLVWPHQPENPPGRSRARRISP